MLQIKNRLRKFVSHTLNFGIVKKVILGYTFIIFIPIFILGLGLYRQVYAGMLDDYLKQKQQFLEQADVSLNIDLTRIEAVYNLFQYNTNVLEYLSGYYDTDAETVYSYVKYIRPLFDYISIGIPSIKDVRIYKTNPSILPQNSIIVNRDQMDETALDMQLLLPGQGLWIYRSRNVQAKPELKYYQKIYDKDFNLTLGILEISVKDDILGSFESNLKDDPAKSAVMIFLNDEDQIVYESGDFQVNFDLSNFQAAQSQMDKGAFGLVKQGNRNYLINTVAIKALNLRMMTFELENEALADINKKSKLMLLYILALLAVLSAIYYYVVSNLTRRILKLAKHMRSVDEKHLTMFNVKTGQDEIGFLIESYNTMIRRINELIITVHRAELLSKEADYAALQAQVKPHFLYGTLESIRMLAESNGDAQVSDIIFTLGKLLRYNLPKKNRNVTLDDEIENVSNFLEIQKMRMGERLQYQIIIRDEIDTCAHVCPQFILQPLVENCIRHGLGNRLENGLIVIEIRKRNNYLKITIQDNGVGISDARLNQINQVLANQMDIKNFQTDQSGIGIYNVNERIKSFFGGESHLKISSSFEAGTQYTLYLQIKEP